MEAIKLEALSEIEIFQDLSDQEMEEMDRSTTMSTCEPGRVFYGPDEAGEVLFLLKKGRVQLYRLSTEGKKLVVAVLEKGAIFGEMSLLDGEPHAASVIALEDTELSTMSQEEFDRVYEEMNPIMQGIIQLLLDRLRQSI